MSQKEYNSTSSSSRPSLTPDGASTSTSLMDAEMTGPLTPSRSSISHSSSATSRNMSSYQQGTQGSGEFPSRLQPNSLVNTLQNRSGPVWPSGNYTGYPPPGLAQSMYTPSHGHQNGHIRHVGSPPPHVYVPPRVGTVPAPNGADHVPLNNVCPGPVYPQEDQLNMAYAYGIQRTDGNFTRLVRADELAGNHSGTIPVSQGPEGLIIVPAPRQSSPSRRHGPMPLVPANVVATLPVLGAPYQSPGHGNSDNAQWQIDHIVAQSTIAPPPPPRRVRKEKIYCDKWIHEGVCAFTQMGCKFKHEMPTDKATQISLGLTHGYPNWYRRTYAVQLNTSPQSESAPNPISQHSRTISGNWRHIEGATGTSPTPSNVSYPQPAAAGQGRGSFGPIGPPPSQPMFSNNPYSALGSFKSENDVVEEANETITWRGRNN